MRGNGLLNLTPTFRFDMFNNVQSVDNEWIGNQGTSNFAQTTAAALMTLQKRSLRWPPAELLFGAAADPQGPARTRH